jgi:hypothetical protein
MKFAVKLIWRYFRGGLAVFIGYFTLEETLPPHDEKHDTHSTQKKSDIASYRAALKVPHFVVITVVFCCE